MLIQISDELFVKSDNYNFMICVDKGDVKFPGGVISRYYKPFLFVNVLNMIPSVKEDKYFDGFTRYCADEIQFKKSLSGVAYNGDITVFEQDIIKSSDCFVVKNGSLKSYCHNFNLAVWQAYINAVRVSDISTMDELYSIMNDFKSKFCI
jgi:hypothetical protein